MHTFFGASSLFLMREKIIFKTSMYSYQEGLYMHKLAVKGTSTASTSGSEIYLISPTFLPSDIKASIKSNPLQIII